MWYTVTWPGVLAQRIGWRYRSRCTSFTCKTGQLEKEISCIWGSDWKAYFGESTAHDRLAAIREVVQVSLQFLHYSRLLLNTQNWPEISEAALQVEKACSVCMGSNSKPHAQNYQDSTITDFKKAAPLASSLLDVIVGTAKQPGELQLGKLQWGSRLASDILSTTVDHPQSSVDHPRSSRLTEGAQTSSNDEALGLPLHPPLSFNAPRSTIAYWTPTKPYSVSLSQDTVIATRA